MKSLSASKYSCIGGVCLALLLQFFGSASAAETPDSLQLEELMHHFSTTRGVQATFEEHKEMALLEAPIVSRGVLYFIPPNRMVRRTQEPMASTLIVDGDRLVFHDALGEDDVDLSSRPEARQIVEHMLVLFNGDLAALEKKYAVSFESERDQWKLLLKPRMFPAKALIESVLLVGNGQALLEMLLVETDGDKTRTFYSDVQIDRAFDEAELAELFPQAPNRNP